MSTTLVKNSSRKTAPALNRTIWALAKQWKLDETDVRELNFEVNGTRKLSALTDPQANRLIKRLGGRESLPVKIVQPVEQPTNKHGKPLSRRAVQYRRKTAGIRQIETQPQFKLLLDYGSKCEMTVAQLESFCIRQIKRPRPQTTNQANSVIEALKSMWKRGWRAGGVGKAAA